MSKQRKLVNKLKRRERYIREGTESIYKMDKQEEILQSSPKALNLLRGAQRRYDSKFGYDAVGDEPKLQYKAMVQTLARFDFDPGAGTDYGMRITFAPDQIAAAEITQITAVADTGALEAFTLTAPTFAGAAQADYFTFEAPDGDIYAVWLDKDDAGTPPTGATYLAADQTVEVDITTGDTAVDVAAAIVSAIGAVADLTITDNLDGTISFEYDLMGDRVDAVSHDEDDSGAGSIGIAIDSQGDDSNLNSSYFLLDTPSTDYYVWMDVNSEGVDPVIGGRTGVHIVLAAGASANSVAAAIAAALDLLAPIAAGAVGAVITVTNAATGDAPDAEDGAAPTGFDFEILTQGQATDGQMANRIGMQPGDSVQILEGDLEGRMLEVVEVLNGYQVRLDDVSSYTGPESDIAIRVIMSGMKKSFY